MSNWKHPPKKRSWLQRHGHNIFDAILIAILIGIWIGYIIARKDLGL